jgi:predicted permease
MNWVKRLVMRRRMAADVTEEIRQHLEEKVDDLLERGFSRDDATRIARREFGNDLVVMERSRDVWRWIAAEDFIADVGYALRQLRRQPSFAVVVVLTLALAIGANTAVFSVVNAVLLRPLPYVAPDRLVTVQSLNTQRGAPSSLSYPNFFDFRARNHVFAGLVSFRSSSFTLRTDTQAIHIAGAIVSADLFSVLGVQPALGRGFVRDEEAPGVRVVVLSDRLWRDQFAGDISIVGRSITLNAAAYTVVGVAPATFTFPPANDAVQLWTVLSVDMTTATVRPLTAQRGARTLDAIARLKPGVTVEQAGADLDAIAQALALEYPDDNTNYGRVYIQPALDRLVGPLGKALLIVLGAVGLVLLIACANLATLLLSRTAEREREFAVRASIGASRQRVIRQLLTEAFVLAVIGGIGSVFVALLSLQLIPAVVRKGVPRLQEVTLDQNVLLFTSVIVVITCVLFSLTPAWRLANAELVGQLKRDCSRRIAPGRDRLHSALAVGQIALSLALVSGAVLLGGSLIQLLNREPGFTPRNVLKFSLGAPVFDREADTIAFYDRVLERVSTMPGVQSVAGGGPLPFAGDQMSIGFTFPDRVTSLAERPRANVALVTPNFFNTLGIRLLKGRDFTAHDTTGSPLVVIVNEAFARRFFPGEDAIGKGIQPGIATKAGTRAVREIVGIVANATQTPSSAEPEPIYYVPFAQVPWFIDSVIVRTAVSPMSLVPAVRDQLRSIDKDLPLYDVATMEDLVSTAIAPRRFQMLLVGSFAGLALLLAAIGLYGVLSRSVGARTSEIGVRMALGATRASVIAMIIRQAMILAGTGIALGLVGATGVTQLVADTLYGVHDHTSLLSLACVVMIAVSGVATFFPARRAASIDPTRALRAE